MSTFPWEYVAAAFDPTGTLATAIGVRDAKEQMDKETNSRQTAGPQASASGTPQTTNAQGTTIQIQCVGEYELRDGFLLNTRTGAVWVYDKAKEQFKYVEKAKTEMTKAALSLANLLMIDQLQKVKGQLGSIVHYSVAADCEKQVGSMIKVLQKNGG